MAKVVSDVVWSLYFLASQQTHGDTAGLAAVAAAACSFGVFELMLLLVIDATCDVVIRGALGAVTNDREGIAEEDDEAEEEEAELARAVATRALERAKWAAKAMTVDA
jgi:hypothetical protein